MNLQDWNEVAELLGREPRCCFEVAVCAADGKPRVIKNDPLLFDATPMPTLFWLVDPRDVKLISQLESQGGVRAAERSVAEVELAAAHRRYAGLRDELLPDEFAGPKPTGGVGGTAVGVKCLHAHYAWWLAGGDDPVGRWAAEQLGESESSSLPES